MSDGLTQEEYSHLLDHIQEKGIQAPPCSFCRLGHYVTIGIAELRLRTPRPTKNARAVPQVAPVVLAQCGYCGHVIMINALAAGVVR